MFSKNPQITIAKSALYLSISLIVFPLVFFPVNNHSYADSKSRHDEVLKFRQSNDVLSFKEVMELVLEKTKGEILEAEFEYEDGIPVYEFKYISVNGRVREIYVNARNGEIIKDKLD